MRPRLGRFAERYELRRALGTGGHSWVYEARHAILGSLVALKIERPGARGFLKREGQLLARLSHRAFVRVIDAGTDCSGLDFLALELLRGPTIREALADGPFCERRALAIVREITEAVRTAHAQGIVLADIKPQNVVLPDDNRPRIIDLGIAACIGEPAGEDGFISGTWSYMPPEVLENGRIAPTSDLYAIATTLYEMLAGRHPRSDGGAMPTRAEVIRRARYSSAPPPIDGVSPGVMKAISRALAPDPGRRYLDLAEFGEALRAVG